MPHHSVTRGLRPRATLAALATLVLVLAACGASGTSEAPESQTPASEGGGGGTTVTLSGSAFSVDEISVPLGSLTFVNEDGVTHIIAEGENGVEVDSPRVEKVSIGGGGEGDLEFTVAGDYHITCTVHSNMNMEVKVE